QKASERADGCKLKKKQKGLNTYLEGNTQEIGIDIKVLQERKIIKHTEYKRRESNKRKTPHGRSHQKQQANPWLE
ncbi:hypothetical protein ACQWFX_25615, partial [Salmonella enterica subsp. enterica serovar Infantis]